MIPIVFSTDEEAGTSQVNGEKGKPFTAGLQLAAPNHRHTQITLRTEGCQDVCSGSLRRRNLQTAGGRL